MQRVKFMFSTNVLMFSCEWSMSTQANVCMYDECIMNVNEELL